jgi:hypothetical protein
MVFSHLTGRRPEAAPSGATQARPAQVAGVRVPSRAARPLVAVLACAAAVTIAGCKPGALGASPSATPSSGAVSSAQARAASPANVVAALARNAPGVSSLVATLQIQATGRPSEHLSGILIEQTRPSALIDVRTTQPAGLEAVLTSSTAYLKIGALTQAVGKPWVAVPYSGLAAGSNASLAPMIQEMQGSNPLAQAQMFPAATNVRESGTSMINGVPVTEYSGSYSVAAGLAQLSPGLRTAVRSGLMPSGITSTKFAVWVGARHQVRKISLVEFGKSAQIEIVFVIVSINQPVAIGVPAASEVAGAAGVTAAPAPSVTAMPTPSAAPIVTVTPTPSAAAAPTPGPTGAPAPDPTSFPTHW